MAIFWLIIGAVIGFGAAWLLMSRQYGSRLSDARTTAETIRNQSQARIASLEHQIASRDIEISDLKAGRPSTYSGRRAALEAPPATSAAEPPELGTSAPARAAEPRPEPPSPRPRPTPAPPPTAESSRPEPLPSRPRPSPPPRPSSSSPPRPSRPSAEPSAAPAKPAAPLPRAATPESKPALPPRKPDDLTRIHGIGKVLNRRLREQGITTFRQIAEFTPADIARVTKVLDFPGRIEREKWVDQAKAFLAESQSESSEQPRER